MITKREALTHVGGEDVRIATVENLALEVRCERSKAILVVLQRNIPVGRERSGLNMCVSMRTTPHYQAY